jgi:GT2 family glycosyltransferase
VPSLTIFLLTHNRTKQALAAIKSILTQTSSDYQLVVSDNSDTNELEAHLGSYHDKIIYLKRSPVLPAMDHFNQCLTEVNTEYFCLFHDDDLMLSNYVNDFLEGIKKYPDAIAFGCNAKLETVGIKSGISFKSNKPFSGPITFNNLVSKYFSKHQNGIAPFPSYAYHKKVAQSLKFASNAGKYGDVQFLIQVANLGKMVWISNPMMIYKLHGTNDGGIESRRDRLRFLRFLKNFSGLDKVLITDYRYFMYRKIIAGNESSDKTYLKILASYIVGYRFKRYFRIDTYLNLLKKYFEDNLR